MEVHIVLFESNQVIYQFMFNDKVHKRQYIHISCPLGSYHRFVTKMIQLRELRSSRNHRSFFLQIIYLLVERMMSLIFFNSN